MTAENPTTPAPDGGYPIDPQAIKAANHQARCAIAHMRKAHDHYATGARHATGATRTRFLEIAADQIAAAADAARESEAIAQGGQHPDLQRVHAHQIADLQNQIAAERKAR